MTRQREHIQDVLVGRLAQWDHAWMADGVLESLQGPVWLAKTVVCRRYGLLGVPAGRVDLAIDQRLIDVPNDDYMPGVRHADGNWCVIGSRGHICEMWIELAVQRKAGRYDGAVRDRLTIRLRPAHQMRDHQALAIGIVSVAGCGEYGGWRIDVTGMPRDPLAGVVAGLNRKVERYLDADQEAAVLWTRKYECLRHDLSAYDPAMLVMWHWSRYYRHLPHDVAASVAAEWALAEFAGHSARWSLAEANRSASRALYRASRDEGWRKLTLRERQALGLPDDAGQWHRADELPVRGATDGTTTGCGLATMQAAAGLPVEMASAAGD